MKWFSKAKVSFAFLLGSALFAATDAHAMKVSEAQKLSPSEQGAYIVNVIDAHLALIGGKNLDLAKKTEIDMYTPAANGLYQGVADIMRYSDVLREKGYADKIDVELVCRLVMDGVWKQKGWTHDGKIANSAQFFPKGYQVAYNPPKKDGGTNNVAAVSAPAKPEQLPTTITNGVPIIASITPR